MNNQVQQMMDMFSHMVALMLVGSMMRIPVRMLQTETPNGSSEDFIKKLPFMPHGTPLPESVYRFVKPEHITSIFKPAVSEYGETLQNIVAVNLLAFMAGGNFTIADKLEETGWSSSDICWNGVLEHMPTQTRWDVEVWANFKRRKPERYESSYIDFLLAEDQISKISLAKAIPKEEVFNRLSFDLTYDEGIRAAGVIQEFNELIR